MSGLFRYANSPFWWMRLPRPSGRAARESTKIAWDAKTAKQRKKNRELAEAVYHARMGDVVRQRHQLPETTAVVSLTLADWLRWYETHIVPTHRGAEREREILKTWTADLGTRALSDVTLAVVQAWVTRRASTMRPPARKPPAPATVNRELDVLVSAMRAAVTHGRLPDDPLDGLQRLHVPTRYRRIMSRDEEARILAALAGAPDDRALLLMGLDTLVRLGDCLDLRWQDDHGKTLWVADPKTGTGYSVPVTARLRAALDAVPKGESPYVFSRRRAPETASQRRGGVSYMLRRACETADPPVAWGRERGGLSWHWATRRTTATRMLLAGVPLPVVQRAGHWASAAVVLDIYAQATDQAVRDALQRASEVEPGETKPPSA